MGLDAVELVLAVEAEFAVSIDDGDAATLTTPRQLATHVIELLARKNDLTRTRAEVLQRIIQFTAAQTGLPVVAIYPDHHFINDIGLD